MKKCDDCDVIMIGETDLHTNYVGGVKFEEQIYLEFEKNVRILAEGQEKIINTYPKRVKARVCPKCGKVELYIDLND